MHTNTNLCIALQYYHYHDNQYTHYIHFLVNLGLEYINYLAATNRKLSIYLEDHVGEVRHANYSTFYISDSSTNYILNVREQFIG